MATTVLVVEDDPVIIDLLTLTMELEGWAVLRAKDAVSALEIARAERPDVVVSDVMMPGRSGLDLIADLAADAATAGTPVVLLSARALPAEVAEGFSAGAVDYVTKPFDPDDLVDRVQAVLDGGRGVTALPWSLLPDTAEVGPDGDLVVGGCRVADLAAEFGTPLFVYDEVHLRNRCREAYDAFGEGVAYATKAFLCRAMARLAHEEGLHLDVATAGELHVALSAGVPAERLVLHGNNKSDLELAAAREAGVGRIVVDSFDEIERLGRLHVADGLVPQVLVRVTPGVEAHTHEFVRTGQDDSKFGFTLSTGAAADAVARLRDSPAVDLVGVHMHIGSQVFVADFFREAVATVAEWFTGLGLPELSIGGGAGVAYVEGEDAPSIAEWGKSVRAACDEAGITARVTAEPGRSIAAAAALTVYTVGTIKDLPGIRTYVAVDGGMSDNPRPVLYGSGYETFLPRAPQADRPATVTVVGKHCESGDLLVRAAKVPADLAVGDLLATPVTGAYGHSMGSNYNKVLRPAVVFVADGDARLVVRRETPDDLLTTDVG